MSAINQFRCRESSLAMAPGTYLKHLQMPTKITSNIHLAPGPKLVLL